jgi:uncharacterized protein
VEIQLGIVFVGLFVYAILPSKWKKIFWVNLIILVPVTGLIIYSQISSGFTLHQLGIRTDNWFAGAGMAALFTGIAAAIMLISAIIRGTLKWNWNMTISVPLYPLWGCLQQFLILSFINVRLMELGIAPIGTAVVTALAFMLLHVPDRWLMPATFVLGFSFSLMFQYEPNLLTFGISHGWLGILYYYWVINKDPIAEKFGKKQ